MESFLDLKNNLSQLPMKSNESGGYEIFDFFTEKNQSHHEDYFVARQNEFSDPYDSIWLKILTIVVYIIEVMASIVMLAFVSFEAQGFAGHYRTLINQLLSYLYGVVMIKFLDDFNY